MAQPLSTLNDLLLPGDNDGLVTVSSTKTIGMSVFLIVRKHHQQLLRDKGFATQIVSFLNDGTFGQFKNPLSVLHPVAK